MDFGQNVGITSFSLEGIYVKNLNLTGCTSLGNKVQEAWNNWKVENLTMQGAGLTGVKLNNTYIKSLDITSNDNMGSLVVNTDTSIKEAETYKNLSTIKASYCALTSVEVYMNVDSSATGSGLYLNDNSLGTTSGKWTTKKEEGIRISEKPESTEKPSNPAVGSTFVEYANITGPVEEDCTVCNGKGYTDTKTVKVNCDACSGTGKVECTECGATGYVDGSWDCLSCVALGKDPITYDKCANCDGDGLSASTGKECPTCNGQGQIEKGRCRVCLGTGICYGKVGCTTCNKTKQVDCSECDGSGKVPATEYYPCTICDNGKVSWYTVDRTIYTFTGSNKLVINGKSISLSYDGSMQNKGNLSVDFAKEWNGLENLQVNLSNNLICYKAGFKYTQEDGTWIIDFKVRLAGTSEDMYVVQYKTDGGEDGQYSFTSYLQAGSTKLKQIGKTGEEHKTYNFKRSSISSAETTMKFTCYRYKKIDGIFGWGWGVAIKSARGPEMYVYPFGESRIDSE